MICTFNLDTLDSSAGRHERTSKPGSPAQIWLSRSLADFSAIWPRSNEPRAARCYAFQYADILELRCATIAAARNVETLFLAVVDTEGNPLMLLPWGIERRWGVRILTFLDGGLCDYNTPVVFPDTESWGENEVCLVWRGLQRILPLFDIAILDKMPSQIGDLSNPLNLLGTGSFPSSGHAATLSGTWPEFESNRLPHRKDSRRLRRRLEERGRPSFEIATTPEQFDSLLAALIRQKLRHHRETFTVAGFEQPGYRAFVTQTTHCLPAGMPVHLSALKLDDAIIAVHWGYLVGRRFYYLIASYEGDLFRSFSPGRILLEHLLKWSFDHGVEIFDFGVGDEDYKTEYCDVIIPLRIAMRPITLRGIEYLVGLRVRDRITRKVRNTAVGRSLKRVFRPRTIRSEQRAECCRKRNSDTSRGGR
jgi:CelD/BcsL family acetyltransferase involved in cellulose biosynthesis